LRDSLADARPALGNAAVAELRERAVRREKRLGLASMEDEKDVRDEHPQRNPFSELHDREGAVATPAGAWFEQHRNDVDVETVLAVESDLIYRAVGRYGDRAEREADRRRTVTANPLRGIRETHGDRVADEVAWHAAVRASNLPGTEPEKLRARSREVWDELRRIDPAKDGFVDTLAEAVAIQHHSNATRELEHAQGRPAEVPETAHAGPGWNAARGPEM
jgi:hypothetical protein